MHPETLTVQLKGFHIMVHIHILAMDTASVYDSWNHSTHVLFFTTRCFSQSHCVFFYSLPKQKHTWTGTLISGGNTYTHTLSIDMKASPQLFWCRASWLMHRRNKMSAFESIRLNSEGCRASHAHTQMHKRMVTRRGLERKAERRENKNKWERYKQKEYKRERVGEIHISVSYFWLCPFFTHLHLPGGWGRQE